MNSRMVSTRITYFLKSLMDFTLYNLEDFNETWSIHDTTLPQVMGPGGSSLMKEVCHFWELRLAEGEQHRDEA